MLAGSETAAIASGSTIPSLGSRAASAPMTMAWVKVETVRHLSEEATVVRRERTAREPVGDRDDNHHQAGRVHGGGLQRLEDPAGMPHERELDNTNGGHKQRQLGQH